MISIMKSPSSCMKIWNLELLFHPKPPKVGKNTIAFSTTVGDQDKIIKDPKEKELEEWNRKTFVFSETEKVSRKVAISKKDLEKLSSISPTKTLNVDRLREYLHYFGEFPDKFRFSVHLRFPCIIEGY